MARAVCKAGKGEEGGAGDSADMVAETFDQIVGSARAAITGSMKHDKMEAQMAAWAFPYEEIDGPTNLR